MQTKNCVRCFKPAKIWTGHVVIDGVKITAGWCSDKCLNTKGFLGQYINKMGLMRDDDE